MKTTLQKRTAIARSLYRLVFTNTESFADDFGIIGDSGKEYNGSYPIGADLAYLLGAILDDTFFEASPGTNALADWLRAEHPKHPANRFILVSTECTNGDTESHVATSTVGCAICHKPCNGKTAHLHQDGWIGDECCWDERLRASE